jgi:hypothetical protein
VTNQPEVVHQDVWGWKVLKYSKGNLRFSIWDNDDEICWCRTEEQAKNVLKALKKAEFA